MKTGITHSEWYSAHRGELTQRGLYFRGQEIGRKNIPDDLRQTTGILIARLSTYPDTTDSYTHTYLYSIAASLDGVYPDLAFLPAPRDRNILLASGVPLLLATASKLPPAAFDIIALSNSFAQELINLPHLLEKSGISLDPRVRSGDESLPLILLGGANASSAFILDTPDSPVDGIFVGEDEECITRLFTLVRDGKKSGMTKAAILEGLCSVEGFFRPGTDSRPVKLTRSTAFVSPLLADQIVPYTRGDEGRGIIPVSEGCLSFCSFCHEGFTRKPYREANPGTIVDEAVRQKAGRALTGIDLFSFNYAAHSGFADIIRSLAGRFQSVGLKSQRFDTLVSSPELAGLLQHSGKGVLTCGMEGISDRMRRFLNKQLTTETLLAGVRNAAGRHFRELKIFLIATGREDKNDFAEFRSFCGNLKDIIGKLNGFRVVFSMTPLVIFPHTPLDTLPDPDPEAQEITAAETAAICARNAFEFRLAAPVSESRISCALLRPNDPGLWSRLSRAILDNDIYYYTGLSPRDTERLSSVLGDRDAAWRPFERLQLPVSRSYLDFQAGLNSAMTETAACREGVNSSPEGKNEHAPCGECRLCAGFGTGEYIRSGAPQISRGLADEVRNLFLRRVRDGEMTQIGIQVGPALAGLPAAYVRTAFSRSILRELYRRKRSDLVEAWRGSSGSLWAEGDEPGPGGFDIMELLWDGDKALEADELIGSLIAHPESRKRMEDELPSGCCFPVTSEPAERNQLILTAEAAAAITPGMLSSLLSARNLKHTMTKTPDGADFPFSREAVKKDIIVHCGLRFGSGKTVITIVPGSKFRFAEWEREVGKLVKGSVVEWISRRLDGETAPL